MTQLVEEKTCLTIAPCFLIRSTGFPFEYLDTQRMPISTLYARRLMALQQCRDELRKVFEQELFPTALDYEQLVDASPSLFKLWYRVRRCVSRNQPCPVEVVETVRTRLAEIATWLESWNALASSYEILYEEYACHTKNELHQAREKLYRIVMDERFQEALLLSNPNMYTTAIASYVRHYHPTQRSAKVRQLENRFYAYLQRFCAKNDTTSFFGPIDYGQVNVTAARALTLVRGAENDATKGLPASLQRRKTRMAYWAVDTLAQCIAKEQSIQPHLQPQLQGGLTLLASGDLYITTTGRRLALSEDVQRLIAAIDGQRTLQEIIDRNTALYPHLFHQLCKQGVVSLQIKLPTAAIDPLAWLSDYVAHLPEHCTARGFWLRSLDAFAASICRFTTASAPEKLVILQEIEREFVLLTHQEPRRGEGEIYTDRLLIYDEAQGDITSCIMGGPLQNRLLQQLRPALDLCVSYSLLVQQVCRKRAREVFHALSNGEALPFLFFLQKLEASVRIEDCLADPAVQNFLERLNELAHAHIDDDCIKLRATDIHPFLQPVPDGTLVSPDLFLTVPDPASASAEDYAIVLGELHYGAQIWCHFLTFYEKQQDLYASLTGMLNGNISSGKAKATLVHKRQQGKTFYLELPGYSVEIMGRSLKQPSEILPAADLEVVLVSDNLLLRSRSNNQIIELYPGDPRCISNWLFSTPPVMCPVPDLGTYTPRIMIEDVVIWRKSWQLQTENILPGETISSSSSLLLHALSICKRYGLPDRCFARIPSERKPFYVDFTSLLSVEFFFIVLRNSSTVTITEMLPGPEMWWFREPDGVRGCEWRMTLIYNANAGNDGSSNPV